MYSIASLCNGLEPVRAITEFCTCICVVAWPSSLINFPEPTEKSYNVKSNALIIMLGCFLENMAQ